MTDHPNEQIDQLRQTQRDRIITYIEAYKLVHDGNAPSQQRIASSFGISRQAVHQHILKLEAEGRVYRDNGRICLVRRR